MKYLTLALMLIAAGCGKAPLPETKAVLKKELQAVEYFRVDPATAGAVSGKVAFRGKKPPRVPIKMETEAFCGKAHAGKPVYDEPVITAKDGGLASAFVYIKSGLDGKNFEPPKEKVTLDQHGCIYVPRIFGIQVGQTLAVKNSDPVSHNIHPLPKENREWSQQQSPESTDLERKFARAELMIPIKCDVHKWMRAYAGVLPHPYFAVTGADGSFELRNLPPGEYTVGVWHETLGERTGRVQVPASGAASVNLNYE